MSALEILQNVGFPGINSFTRAVQNLRLQYGELRNIAQYEQLVKEVTDIDRKFNDIFTARYTFLFLMQDIIRSTLAGTGVPESEMLALLSQAEIKAKDFLFANPWSRMTDEVGVPAPEGSTVRGTKTKARTGETKAERAKVLYGENREKTRKELIELFMKELGMSKAGASTYVYNMQREFGDKK